MRFAAPVCAVLLLASGDRAPAGTANADLQNLWRTVGQFTPSQVTAVERGEPVAKVLRTDRREIAIMGVVRIRGARGPLIERYRDISNLRKSELVMQVGTFGHPPRAQDLQPLAFERYDLEAPKDCRPGKCAIRASSEAIARMHGAVNWGAGDAQQQSAVAWREMLGALAGAYATEGDAALPVLVNKEEPLSVRAELDVLYGRFGFLGTLAPEFFRYVREFPRARLDGAEDTIYWSKNDLGIRPVVGITHQTIYAPAGKPAYIALKRIYAVHYIDAGLDVTMVTDDGTGGFYMTTVDWVRTRSLTGFTRAIVRSIVQDKSRSGVEKLLQSSKRAIETISSAR